MNAVPTVPAARPGGWHNFLGRALATLDPRRSLGTKVGWFVAALTLAFALGAALWLGELTRAGLLVQHYRVLALDGLQVANTLDQALEARLRSLQAAAAILGSEPEVRTPRALHAVLAELSTSYPELQSIRVAPARELARPGKAAPDAAAGASTALAGASRRLAIRADPPVAGAFGPPPGLEFEVPIRDPAGKDLGVVLAHLDGPWLQAYALGLRRSLRPQNSPNALLVDAAGVVRIGPPAYAGRPLVLEDERRVDLGELPVGAAMPAISEARLPDGLRVVVARVPAAPDGVLQALGWKLTLLEPTRFAQLRGDELWSAIAWMAIALGSAAALVGVLLSRRLTRRLGQLTQSVDAVATGAAQGIAVPPGRDEITRLARAFAALLDALHQQRAGLSALSADLERRVAERTRELERMAREARYAAVVRERLKIARDLHDTLAHSMMAMLAQIRLLRRLQRHDPAALAAELARAEQVALEGLSEARASIAQMRVNPVRDIGLGSALSESLRRFAERSGIAVDSAIDPAAAGFAEETAEAVLRIAEEALRNIEQHANATRVQVRLEALGAARLALSIVDNGAGFDPRLPHPGHFGLVGMHEQAQRIGAELRIDSAPGQGTQLQLRFTAGI